MPLPPQYGSISRVEHGLDEATGKTMYYAGRYIDTQKETLWLHSSSTTISFMTGRGFKSVSYVSRKEGTMGDPALTHVALRILACKELLEGLVDPRERDALGHELLDVGKAAGTEESEGVRVGISGEEIRNVSRKNSGIRMERSARVAEDSEEVNFAEGGGGDGPCVARNQ